MKTQTFVANDIRQALAMAREAMGSDAIVVSTRRVGDKTEVVASSEAVSTPTQVNTARETPTPGIALNDQHVSSIISVIQDEVNRLREVFQSELQHIGWREMANKQPIRFELVRRLVICGFSRHAAGSLVDKILPCKSIDQGWAALKLSLKKYIPVSPSDMVMDGGIFALIGSTGVGKTTTAAKLAGQFAKQHGYRNVAFVSMDKFKIGGHEQLVSLGTMFGIPVQPVSNPEEMERTLHSLSSKKLIIIDTAGVSQRDKNLNSQLGMLRVNVPIKPLLVIPATSRTGIIKETIDFFSSISPSAAIVTKVDEADCIAPILANIIVSRLPLAYLSHGQNVPEDITAATSEMIIEELELTYRLSVQKNQSQRTHAKAFNQ
jgi:flagellar biosynthesis protein FlhF